MAYTRRETAFVALLVLLLRSTVAFSVPGTGIVVQRCPLCGYPSCQSTTRLSASPDGNDELTPTERILENEKLDPATRAVVEAAAKRNAVEDEEKPYPIDLPSPVLLATSMVLAIVSTGSLFELVGGSSATLPFAATAAIAAIGTPTAIFLLLAAIAKAKAETEEDDKKFLSGK